jgi:hypothetical protein
MNLRHYSFIAPVLVSLLICCTGQKNAAPPSLPPASPVGEPSSVQNAAVGVMGFFFGDDFGKLFIRISRADWQPLGEGVKNPRLQSRGPLVVVRSTGERTALFGTQIEVYRDFEHICKSQVGDHLVVSRMVPHFGSLEDLGLSSEPQVRVNPDFDAILAMSSHYLGLEIQDCAGWKSGSRDNFYWARPASLPPPALWYPADEREPAAARLQKQVDKKVMELPFGGKVSEYRKNVTGEDLTVRTKVFTNEKDFLIEDFRQIGETMCGGDGHELWSLWTVVDGEPIMLMSSELTRRILLVGDLDQDGQPEIVIQEGPLVNERIMYRLRNGKLEKVFEDRFPFNDCPC